jgi:hypothetical protein
MDSTDSNDRILKIVQGLFLLNAAIWIVFSIIRLVEIAAGPAPVGAIFQAVAVLMFGNAVAMLLAAWLVGKQDVWGYLFALAILVVNIFFTFTDQVGFFDWATFGVDLVILGILTVKRKVFLPASSAG